MKFDVTEREYLDAVTEACNIVDQCNSDPRIDCRMQDVAIKRFISAIYDPIVPCSVLEILAVSDPFRKNLLIILLIGRCKYGRPRHNREEDILKWVFQCMKDNME